MKFELKTYNRNSPDEKLVSDVKRVANELNKVSVTIDDTTKEVVFMPQH